MTKELIKKEVVALISSLFYDQENDFDMIESVNLIDDLGMDSITFISLVVKVEDTFSIEIPDEILLMENFKCIENIVSIIDCELAKKT